MDRATNRELELRSLLREIDGLSGRAARLETQTRQLHLNSIAKLDARDWVVAATESKHKADELTQATDGLERRAKSLAKGGTGESKTLPGLIGSVKDKASRLTRSVRGLQKELDRLKTEAQTKMNDPLRHAAGASLAFPGGDILMQCQGFFGGLQNLIGLLKGL